MKRWTLIRCYFQQLQRLSFNQKEMASVCIIMVTNQLLMMTSIAMRIHGSDPTTMCSVSIGACRGYVSKIVFISLQSFRKIGQTSMVDAYRLDYPESTARKVLWTFITLINVTLPILKCIRPLKSLYTAKRRLDSNGAGFQKIFNFYIRISANNNTVNNFEGY